MTIPLDTLRPQPAAHEAQLRRRFVRHIALFGSVASGEDRADRAVQIDPERSFSLIRLEKTRLLLQDAIGRTVNHGKIESLRPTVRPAFERDRVSMF